MALPIISVKGLEKAYGDVRALTGLDLEVTEGSVLGVLGPNGAGKTTAVSIMTTLIRADAGSVNIAGIDVAEEPSRVRSLIGLSGQYAAVDEHLTGFENLDLIGRLYHLGNKAARARANELLERFHLTEAGDRPVGGYSGGMRRRLDLAGALVAKPRVLFLDEPTTGLDPRSRSDLWDVIRELVSAGTTLLLTTQYMEEAEQLADEIVVIDRGRKIAEGTSEQLKSQTGGDRIEVQIDNEADREKTERILASVSIGELVVDGRVLSAPVSGGPRALSIALRHIDDAGIDLADAGLRRPTLDEVFLSLTGEETHVLKEAS